jgi:hypothetical protein
MKVTPVKKFNGRMPGEVMTLPDVTARALIKVGLMREVMDEDQPRTRRKYVRRDMQAEA